MARRHAVAMMLALVATLSAGCSGGKEYAPFVPAEPAPPSTTTGTLHLLDGGALGTQAPSQTEPSRLTVMSLQSNEDGATWWTFTWPTDTDRIGGVARLVVSVEGLVVNAQADARLVSCFWALQVLVFDGDPLTDAGGGVQVCVEEPRVVPTGIRTLELPFELVGERYAAGFQAQVTLMHMGTATGDAKLELLTASAEHDSTVTFDGVEWPVGLPRIP